MELASTRKRHATDFENRIKSFLEKLQFEDIDGARDNFLIGGVQVDVCGGHDKTLLVFECTMSKELKKKSLRDKIKEMRGSVTSWGKGFRADPLYKKYDSFVYILAVKNVEIRQEDIDFANADKPKVFIFDEDFFDYYEDLFNKINQYAKFNLLGELKVRPIVDSTISVPAFSTELGKTIMYSFFISPKDLMEVSYVARRESKHERFYQRTITKARLKSIAKFIEQGNILPNNLIISFGDYLVKKKYVRFLPIEKDYIKQCTAGIGIHYEILSFPRDYRSCWIIDGQHRLFSFVNTDKNTLMPVIAFANLDLEKQSKIFLDINKNQKPVPADLVWDLNGDMIPNEEDGIISNVVKYLNKSDPLVNKIKIISRGSKINSPLRIAGICLSLKKSRLVKEYTHGSALNPYFFKDSNDKPNPEKIIRTLGQSLLEDFKEYKNMFAEDWERSSKGFILDDSGMSLMIRLFEKITNYSVSVNHKKIIPTNEIFIKYLTPIIKLLKEKYLETWILKNLRGFFRVKVAKVRH